VRVVSTASDIRLDKQPSPQHSIPRGATAFITLQHRCYPPCKVATPRIAAPGLAKDGRIFDVIGIPRHPHPRRRRSGTGKCQSGQSLVEFALVLPILVIIFVAVADFGRIFATGIELEAATRNAAEGVANQYLATPPGPLNTAAPAGSSTYYDPLHAYGASVVCAELRDLPNTNYDTNTATCPDMVDGSSPPKTDMPIVVVCVHDSQDTSCAVRADPGSGGIPAECSSLVAGPTDTQVTNPDGTKPRFVEVRSCYQFTSFLDLPLFSFGNFWLQETATFTIPCYFALGTPDECG
jgi:hypothetical protein